MNTELISVIIFASVVGAVLIGRMLACLLPQDHLSADTKDTVKLAMGLLATMSALLLGLLVASTKGSYDNARNEFIQMAAKVVFLDRVLTGYGPETGETRALLREAVEELAYHSMQLPKANTRVNLAPNTQAGNVIYLSIQHLTPQDEMQRSLKAQATTLALELGQLRTLLVAESISSISKASANCRGMLACADLPKFCRDRASQRDRDDSFNDLGSFGCGGHLFSSRARPAIYRCASDFERADA
jgi:hypothetical protein